MLETLVRVAFVSVILFIVGVPMLGGIGYWRFARRLQRVARSARCDCGARLDSESVRLGNELWGRHMAAPFERFPGRMLRVVRFVYAVCPRCGARYDFHEATGSFSRTQRALEFEAK